MEYEIVTSITSAKTLMEVQYPGFRKTCMELESEDSSAIKEAAMSLPQVLEVVIGLVLIYYILGAIVSTFTKMLTELLETRGVALEKYLRQIAGDRSFELTNLPQIRALRPIRYANWWNVFGAGTEAKKVEKIPVSTLVDAFFDLSGLTNKDKLSADELSGLISKLPDFEGKRAMLGWLEQGVTSLNDLRTRTSDYFNGLLGQAALTFKARARSIVIILSMLVTLILGTDSIQLAKDLWADAGLRALAAEQAKIIVSQPPGDNTQIPDLLKDLSAFRLRWGWWETPMLPPTATPVNWFTFAVLKVLGLGVTAVAVSQGSSFWYDLLRKLAGRKDQPVVAEEGEAG